MLPYSMLSSHSVQSPRPSPLCALSVPAFSSPSISCSGGSSDPCLSPLPWRSASSPSRPPMELLTASRFPLSANVDVVDAASSISPLFATLAENTGGGVPSRSLPGFVVPPALSAAQGSVPGDLFFPNSLPASLNAGVAPVQVAGRPKISCGFPDAETRRHDTPQPQPAILVQLNILFSYAYKRPRPGLSRQMTCTPLVPVCDTIERNEGCSHASQKTHQHSSPSLRSKTFFRAHSSSACSLRTRVSFLDRRSALAAPHARRGAASPSRSEDPRPQHCASVLERGGLRRDRFVRRPARGVPSLRISSRARSGRRCENLSDRKPHRQARELQHLYARRKRPAHGRPSPQPHGITRAHHALRTHRLDAAGSRSRAAAKPHVRERLQCSHRAKTRNPAFVSALAGARGFSRLQIADRLARRR